MPKRKPDHKTGTCAACNAPDVPLVAMSSKSGGKVCDPCFTELKQAGLPFDQFDLKPDEMTIEMLIDYELSGHPTKRTVQNWNKEAKIPFQILRRRTNGTVRKQVIYNKADVDRYFGEANTGKFSPGVYRDNANDNETLVSQTVAFEALGKMLASLPQAAPPRVFDCPPLKRLSIKGAAAMSGIAESHLSAAIKAAELDGIIEHYTGAFGANVYRADQIEFVIENMPPTPKRLAARAGIGNKGDDRSIIAGQPSPEPGVPRAGIC